MREYKFYTCDIDGRRIFLCEKIESFSAAMISAVNFAFELSAKKREDCERDMMICIHDEKDKEVFRTPIPNLEGALF